jgi:hypothetical protein
MDDVTPTWNHIHMRISRPAYRLALTLILTVLLGACGGGGGGTTAAPGAVDGFIPEPTVPTVVDPVTASPDTTDVPGNDLAQVVVSLPADGQFAVGEVLRIAGAGADSWKVTQTGRQEIRMPSLIGKNWKKTDIPVGGFVGVSSSADGRVLAAVGSNGGVYVSTDSGASWTPRLIDGQSRSWGSVSVSADGSKVMAGEWPGFIYVGTPDNGTWTWTKASPKTNETGNWVSVALSRDGSTAVAVDLGGDVYTGTSTTNWTSSTWTGGGLTQDWWGVAISAGGSDAVAVGGGGAFYVKEGIDGQWTIPTSAPQTTVPGADWNHVACSQDCSTIVIAEDGGLIQTSADGGANWQKRTTAGAHDWYYVASSTDGIRLAAVANGDKIYFSGDGGKGWTSAAAPGTNTWWSVACSADCTKMVVGADQIWTSIAGTTPGAQGSISGGPSDVIELEYLGSDVWHVVNQTGSPTIQ